MKQYIDLQLDILQGALNFNNGGTSSTSKVAVAHRLEEWAVWYTPRIAVSTGQIDEDSDEASNFGYPMFGQIQLEKCLMELVTMQRSGGVL